MSALSAPSPPAAPEPRWPGQTDYQDAMLDPRSCFTNTALRRSNPTEFLPFGLPRPIAGQFANVYQMRLANGGIVAVRLFLHDQPEREAHYAALDSWLSLLGSDAPAALVRFQYQREGFVVGGVPRPLLLMDWVDGIPLSQFIEQHIMESSRLLALAEQWNALTKSLTAAKIAHGDLQHGNVLVENGPGDRLRLIDYDGVWVPSLTGSVGLEFGHPAYRHRDRQATDFGPEMDRVPAMVVYASLRVVAAAPELWHRLHDGDNLLFQQEDLRDPEAGRAFLNLSLTRSLDPRTMKLIQDLRYAATSPYPRTG